MKTILETIISLLYEEIGIEPEVVQQAHISRMTWTSMSLTG